MMKESIGQNTEEAAVGAHAIVEQNWSTISANFLQILGTQLGILSLTEDPCNSVMWGHYANSSRGFVIGFDECHPWFNQKRSASDEFCHLRKVTYIKENSPRYFSDLTSQDIGYSKLDGWSYEKEWRILFPLQRGIDTNLLDSFGQPIILFPFPSECLTEIIIGSRATAKFAEELRQILKGLPIHVPVSNGLS